MTYRIEGLSPDRFASLIGAPDAELAEQGARRVISSSPTGFPCRISLEDAEPGASLILTNFVSHDVETPFRTAYAVFVREDAASPARFEDEVPPLLHRRTLGLRGFDEEGMLRGALLAMPGEADMKIRELFEAPEIATIHAHNAAHGCFLATIERNQ
jgi:hypothetical protein